MDDDLYDKLTKVVTKHKVSYSINKELLDEFNNITKSKKLKKSNVIEKMIKAFVEQEKSLIKL